MFPPKPKSTKKKSAPGPTARYAGVEQPAPPPLPAPTPRSLLASAFNCSEDQIADLQAAEKESNLFVAAALAKEHAQKLRSEAEQEMIRARAARTCLERTRETSDHAWPAGAEDKRYVVFLEKNPNAPGKPEYFPVRVTVRSPEEAKGRYMSLCGIIHSEYSAKAIPAEKFDRIEAKRARLERLQRMEEDEDDLDVELDAAAPEGAFVGDES